MSVIFQNSSKSTSDYLNYICERAQKLTEALYRVTDFFSENEPLKWVLRRESLEIFNSILKTKSSTPNETIRIFDLAIIKIQDIIKIFDIASSGSFVSETNFQVLKREYQLLIGFITENRSGFLPDISDILSVRNVSDRLLSEKKNKQNQSDKDEGKEIEEKEININERREKIISVIKNRDWVSIGDLIHEFDGQISEKTIQRDLVGMANAGLLLKEGDKRWRKYKFVEKSDVQNN